VNRVYRDGVTAALDAVEARIAGLGSWTDGATAALLAGVVAQLRKDLA
jgi:hypothetical protein